MSWGCVFAIIACRWAKSGDVVAMLWDATGSTIRGGACTRGPLHRDEADAARSGVDKHILRRPELRLAKAVVRRGPNDGKRDGLIKGKRRWHATVHVHENRRIPICEALLAARFPWSRVFVART